MQIFFFFLFFSSPHSLFPSYSNLFFFFQIGWRRYCCSILLVESRLLASNPLPLSRWPNIPDILFHFHFHIHFHFPHPLSLSISTFTFHVHFNFPYIYTFTFTFHSNQSLVVQADPQLLLPRTRNLDALILPFTIPAPRKGS